MLVGANGSGKTTLLDVRLLLGDLLRERTISAGFTEQREGRPPRARPLGRRASFAVSSASTRNSARSEMRAIIFLRAARLGLGNRMTRFIRRTTAGPDRAN